MTVLLNTLYVTTPEAYLCLEGETVCVMIEGQKRLQVPLHHLGAFALFNHVMPGPCGPRNTPCVTIGKAQACHVLMHRKAVVHCTP